MSPLKLSDLAARHGLVPGLVLEQFALDAVAAVLVGQGVLVGHRLTVHRPDGRGPYHLEAGDTLRAVEVSGSMRFFTVNNNKDEVILAQSQRIAELLATIEELRR